MVPVPAANDEGLAAFFDGLVADLQLPHPERQIARRLAVACGARSLALLVADTDGRQLLVTGTAGERLDVAAGRRLALPSGLDLTRTEELLRLATDRLGLGDATGLSLLPLCVAPFCLALAELPPASAARASSLVARVGRAVSIVLEGARVSEAAAADRRRAEAVRDIAEAIAHSLDPAHVWETFTSRLRRHLDFDFAALGTPQTAEDGARVLSLEVAAGSSLLAPLGTATVPIGAGDLVDRALTGRPVAVANDLRLSRHRGDVELAALGLTCGLAAPLVARAVPVGVLLLGRMAPPAPAEGELLLVEQAARHLGPALANARAYRDLAALHARLDEESRARETLASLLYHDLRTPLTTVLTTLEYFELAVQLDSEAREGLVASQQALTTVVELITSILDLSQLENARLKCARRSTDVPSLVEPAVAQVRAVARRRGVTIACDCEPGTADLDDTLVARSVRNLLSYALRRTPDGGTVHLTVRTGGHFVAEATDGAPAWPEEQREEPFRKFARIAGSSGLDAHGLGLHFVRLAAEAHGGRAFATASPEGRGRLVFELPPPSARGTPGAKSLEGTARVL